MSTKEALHQLIENIHDEEILKGYLELIQRLNSGQTGKLWSTLSTEEKEELIHSYEESFDTKNLVSHHDVKQQHAQWLKK